MKKLLPVIIVIMVVIFIYLRWNMNRPKYGEVIINNTSIKIELADTIGKQKQGLSGRPTLPDSQGMLFPMGLPDRYNFWMKDMNFPIDIVWIYQSKVIDITENLAPPRGYEQPASASPKEPADMVLEVTAGFIKEHNIQIGNEVRVNTNN
ncbi:MAG: DUF192 domain-containing protein [bacterium]|nr:DUF192 domain-containing protein [bacterium]